MKAALIRRFLWNRRFPWNRGWKSRPAARSGAGGPGADLVFYDYRQLRDFVLD
jgi:hypothetical protein